MKSNKALVIMDYINEFTHPEGKFKGRGYVDFIEKYNIFENINKALKLAREKDFLIIFVRVGFSKDYLQQPKNSILFGKAHELKALTLDTWATEFNEQLNVKKDDIVITKNRVSPFYNTNLENYLSANKIDTIYFGGVATDLVVQSATRDAHDRDYNVFVLEDCSATRSKQDHDNSIDTLSKIATIVKSHELS